MCVWFKEKRKKKKEKKKKRKLIIKLLPVLLDHNLCKINEMLNRHLYFNIAIETFIIDSFIYLQLIINFHLIEQSDERNLTNLPCSNEQYVKWLFFLHLMATFVPLHFPLSLQDMCSPSSVNIIKWMFCLKLITDLNTAIHKKT